MNLSPLKLPVTSFFFKHKFYGFYLTLFQSDKVKQLVHQSRHRPGTLTQSHLALQQDSFAVADSRLGLDCLLADHQMASLDNVVLQHKQSQLRMAKMLRDMELRHLKVSNKIVEMYWA